MAAAAMRAAKRRETDIIKLMMSDFEVFRPSSDRYEFVVRFPGPSDTHYEGGVWLVRVILPDDYPFRSPSVGFCNRMTHPNVCERSGSICLDVLNSTWTPMYDLVNIFSVLLPQLLRYPNPSDPLNVHAAQLMRQSPAEYTARVRRTIEGYASDAFVGRLFAAIRSGDEAAAAAAARSPVIAPPADETDDGAPPTSSSAAASREAASGALPVVRSLSLLRGADAAGAAGPGQVGDAEGGAEPASSWGSSTVGVAGGDVDTDWSGLDLEGDADETGFDELAVEPHDDSSRPWMSGFFDAIDEGLARHGSGILVVPEASAQEQIESLVRESGAAKVRAADLPSWELGASLLDALEESGVAVERVAANTFRLEDHDARLDLTGAPAPADDESVSEGATCSLGTPPGSGTSSTATMASAAAEELRWKSSAPAGLVEHFRTSGKGVRTPKAAPATILAVPLEDLPSELAWRKRASGSSGSAADSRRLRAKALAEGAWAGKGDAPARVMAGGAAAGSKADAWDAGSSGCDLCLRAGVVSAAMLWWSAPDPPAEAGGAAKCSPAPVFPAKGPRRLAAWRSYAETRLRNRPQDAAVAARPALRGLPWASGDSSRAAWWPAAPGSAADSTPAERWVAAAAEAGPARIGGPMRVISLGVATEGAEPAAGALDAALAAVPARAAWLAAGRTGFPSVDAAVRCAATTGCLATPLQRLLLVHATQYAALPWQAAVAWLAGLLVSTHPAELAIAAQWWLGLLLDTEAPADHPHAMADPAAGRYAGHRDPDGAFVSRWCPELEASGVAPAWRYQPYAVRALTTSSARPEVRPHPAAFDPRKPAGAASARASRAEVLAGRGTVLLRPMVEVANAREAVLAAVEAAFLAHAEDERKALDTAASRGAAAAAPAPAAAAASASASGAKAVPAPAQRGWGMASWFAGKHKETSEEVASAAGVTLAWQGGQEQWPQVMARMTFADLAAGVFGRDAEPSKPRSAAASASHGPGSSREAAGGGKLPVPCFTQLHEDLADEAEAGWRLSQADRHAAAWGMAKDAVNGHARPLLTEEDAELVIRLADMESMGKGWEQVAHGPDINLKAWMRPAEENPAFRQGTGTFDVHGWRPADVAKLLSDMRLYPFWADTWAELHPVRRLDALNEAVYFVTRTPPVGLIEPRDFPMVRHVIEDAAKGQFVVYFRSMEHALCPLRKGHTRGVTLGVIGFVVMATGEHSSRVTVVTAADARGSLPAWVINMIGKVMPGMWSGRYLQAVREAFGPPVEA